MARKTILNDHVLSEIRHFSQQVQRAGIPIKKLIVFGSHAKGRAKPWSDIDLCVVSSAFGGNRHTERVLLVKQKDVSSLDIEPHPYHPDDLSNKWDPLAHEITTFGIVVPSN